MRSLEHYYIVVRRWIIRPILNNEKLSRFLSKYCLKTYLCLYYENMTGKRLNMSHPRNINERLMALSLAAYKDPIQHQLRVQCADKYRVREYVKSKGLEDILIPFYGEYDSFDEIDFDKLPNQFVIQTNFGSGQIWICKDKTSADIEKWHKQFDEWMAIKDFGWRTGEWQYNEIPHKLVITKYLDSLGAMSINDYKFHCINGHIYACLVGYDRDIEHHQVQLDLYDTDWNLMDGIHVYKHPHQKPIPKPKSLSKMLKIAETLSASSKYVRVDLYEIGGDVMFGEMTFTPSANIMFSHTNERLIDMEQFFESTK